MMWIVLMQSNAVSQRSWGPFDSLPMAEKFAAFVTAEIDPAVVIPLTLPVWELLAWRDHKQGRDAYTEAVEQLLDNGLMTDLKTTAAAAPTATADHQPNEA